MEGGFTAALAFYASYRPLSLWQQLDSGRNGSMNLSRADGGILSESPLKSATAAALACSARVVSAAGSVGLIGHPLSAA